MIFNLLFGRKADQAKTLYAAIVAAARQPQFYRDMQVPDTIDGRFDMLVLHLALVIIRLHGERDKLRQQLVNQFCVDMDDNVRELGAGDLGVSKKVRRMAEAFQGRYGAYEAAQDLAAMSDAITRNIYAGKPTSDALARYALAARGKLAAQALDDIVAGRPQFT
ncbi:MAG: ubiquinol-cytochrome C chaperone [Pseudomonadota bacterium]|nr:ubiquinol-cytochrome C chaperone [Pseudomonadota bacterium]